MKILFVSHTPLAGGAEEGLMRLLAGLSAEHSVAVACPAPGPLADRIDAAGVTRHSVPAFEASLRPDPVQTPIGIARLGAAAVTLARLVRRLRPDIVHANSPRAGLMSALACRLGGPPLVVHVRDDLPLRGIGRGVRMVLARSADAVVAVSSFTARRFDEGLERPLATPVYNSIDHARFDPDRVSAAPVRDELGIAVDAPLVAQVSQISPWKGQVTAIRALAGLRRGGLDAHLLVVGEVAFAGRQVRYDNRAYLDSLHRLRVELGVTDAVHFLGRRQDVPALLRATDLSVLPSRNEPFGRAIVESMAMGTPALVSESGSGPELIEDGVSGRLLDPDAPGDWAEAAADLIADRAALTRMGAAARVSAARFNDEAQVRGILKVYESALR
jgi:glycosyltransferase involved in cell wall biosynthesis